MRKLASHYIWYNTLYRFHCIVLEGQQIAELFPLEQEEAGIEFLNGLLWVAPQGIKPWDWIGERIGKGQETCSLCEWIGSQSAPQKGIRKDQKITIWHFPDLTLPASEFCTDNGSGYRYVQRL